MISFYIFFFFIEMERELLKACTFEKEADDAYSSCQDDQGDASAQFKQQCVQKDGRE